MRLLKSIALLLTTLTVLLGCGGDSGGGNGGGSGDLEEATGGVYYGGVFKFNETEYFRSLYPQNVTEVVGHRITNQIYEGLVSLKQADLTIEPCLAESWVIDSTATQYTFTVRKGVYFHDDPCFSDGKGREVTAHDFKYVLDRLCEADPNNQGFWVVKGLVTGAEDYFESTIDGNPLEGGVSGVQVIDDYTLQINLDRPNASFLYRLSLPFTHVFPEEAVEAYGVDMREKCVGTGPFVLKTLAQDEAVVLVRNEAYWKKDEHGNQLPYLDGVKVSFMKEEKNELLEFQAGNLHLKYRIPLEMYNEVLTAESALQTDFASFQLQEAPEFSTQYYGYLQLHEVFGNKDVRKAFNYAVDRDKIVEFTMKGQGVPAYSGIVPMGFSGFNNDNVKGYHYDPALAREHLAAAGYPDGEGFPDVTLQINSGGGRNVSVAEAIQKMLEETLNIKVNITQVVWAQHTETLETGKVGFWRLGWVADYPDPENFLNLFHSVHVPETLEEKAYINSFRYKSDEFDAVFEQALQTVDEVERNKLYEQADQIAMDDAVIMPIFYSKNYRLLAKNVRNFPQNAMEYRLLREVYFVP